MWERFDARAFSGSSAAESGGPFRDLPAATHHRPAGADDPRALHPLTPFISTPSFPFLRHRESLSCLLSLASRRVLIHTMAEPDVDEDLFADLSVHYLNSRD